MLSANFNCLVGNANMVILTFCSPLISVQDIFKSRAKFDLQNQRYEQLNGHDDIM